MAIYGTDEISYSEILEKKLDSAAIMYNISPHEVPPVMYSRESPLR